MSRLNWHQFRRRSGDLVTSSSVISPPPRLRKPNFASNSAPAPRHFSRRRNNLAQIPYALRLDRPPAMFSYRGNEIAHNGDEGWVVALSRARLKGRITLWRRLPPLRRIPFPSY